MAEFSTAARTEILAEIRANLGEEDASRAEAMHDGMVKVLHDQTTPLTAMSLVADMLHKGINIYGVMIEQSFNARDWETFSGAMLGLTASIHFIASAIDIRVAEFTEAELFAGVEWDEGNGENGAGESI